MAGARTPMICLAAVGTLVAPSARGEVNRTSSLSWVVLPGAESCGGAGQLARAVEERLHKHAIVSPAQADLSIEARAERLGDPPRWHATVEVRDPTGAVVGTREFNSASSDCSEMRDSVALAIALMIDPDAVLHPPVPAAPPEPRVIVERVEVPIPATAPDGEPWRVRPAASVALGYGVLPAASLGVLVDMAIGPPRFWDVDLIGGAWASQSVSAVDGSMADLSLAFGGLTLCPPSASGPLRIVFQFCAGGELGAFDSAGHGFSVSQSKTGLLAEIVAAGTLRFPLGDAIALQLRGDLGGAVYRDAIVYFDPQGTQSLFNPSPVTASAALGLSLALR
jgi:hypothetical protein